MSLLTTWGYTLTGTDTLADLLNVDEYNNMTGGKYAGMPEQVAAALKASSMSIRNFVGWHLAPSLTCELKTTFFDRRVTRIGGDVQIQLPARYVTDVTSVTIGGMECESFVLDPTGLLWVIGVCGGERFTEVDVIYTAGLPDGMMAAIKELTAHRVTHAVAVPAGVTSEASGGVSVTYNANWINNARASGLADDNKEILIPYRVQGVF